MEREGRNQQEGDGAELSRKTEETWGEVKC